MNNNFKKINIYLISAAISINAAIFSSSSIAANAPASQQSNLSTTANTSTTAPLEDVSPIEPINDPYEKFNRAMFSFNDKLDIYILKPIATLYVKIMPKPLNQGVHNFFNNLNMLPTIANDFLQFNFYQAANDLWRVGVNTTLGIGGIFDVATRINLNFYTNDFGLTLSAWGYKKSNYLVLPFFGPTTIRDGLAIPVDYFGFSVYPYLEPTSTRYEIYTLGVIDRRAQLLKFQPVFEEAALDKYLFIRNAYLQRRDFQIEQNRHLGHLDQAKQNSSSSSEAVVASGEPLQAAQTNEAVEAAKLTQNKTATEIAMNKMPEKTRHSKSNTIVHAARTDKEKKLANIKPPPYHEAAAEFDGPVIPR